MKTAISIPDNIFEEAEKLARRLGISRSELYQRAVARFIEQQSGDVVRGALNRVYGTKTNRDLDPLIKAANEQVLTDENW
jgi:metal-responsive CopG/Arc/MetJ family transcriptional regulator